jgi:hypothetical protein
VDAVALSDHRAVRAITAVGAVPALTVRRRVRSAAATGPRASAITHRATANDSARP